VLLLRRNDDADFTQVGRANADATWIADMNRPTAQRAKWEVYLHEDVPAVGQWFEAANRPSLFVEELSSEKHAYARHTQPDGE
jgi:hypothetical protein